MAPEIPQLNQDLLTQLSTTLADLAALCLRALSADEPERRAVAMDLLESILCLSDAPRGGLVEVIASGAANPGTTDIQPLVLSRIFTHDAEGLLTLPSAEASTYKGGDWLRFELPIHAALLPESAVAVTSQQPRVHLLLGWPPHTPAPRLQQAQTLVSVIVQAVAAVVVALRRPANSPGVEHSNPPPADVDTTWEQIFDAVSDPMCVVTADYKLERANSAYIQLFGLNRHGVPGHECYAQLPGGQSAPCDNCPLPHTIRSGEAAFVQQERLVPIGGGALHRRTYQRWSYPLFRPDGTVDRIVEILKDVTDQERVRQSESQTNALREADHLKSELLGTVSHELRSPLTTIKGYAATLLRHERRLPREERHEFLAAIVEASDALQVIIDRLLEMSQIETGTLHVEQMDVNLKELAQAALDDTTRANAMDSRTFDFVFAADPQDTDRSSSQWEVEGDPRLLRDMLDNLLENAVKYSPSGGRIEVSLYTHADTAPAVGSSSAVAAGESEGAGSRPAARSIEIVVTDNGMGIPVEHLERIFERFHRVDTRLTREVGGLGLGLAICQRVVQLHGGVIWAESRPGEGSSFHVQLPALQNSSTLPEK
jgi:signal transduction histidine kinase